MILTLVVCSFFCLLAGEGKAERAYFDITASELRKIMVAVPAFSGDGQGPAVTQLLSKGLALHSFVSVIDSSRYGGGRDADWKSLGADFVVMGKVGPDPAGMMIEGQILDVASNKLLAGRRYKGSADQLEEMTLRLCDALIEDFTGEMGVARTRMAYISDATGRKEVYVSDILGRHPRQVTSHRALCVSPRFTPDGNFLTYSTYHRGNQDLYITDLRQSSTTTSLSRRKGLNLAPAFTPDGRSMVVTLSQNGNPDLYLMNRQGEILKQLTSGAGINVSPSFSPDGQSMAFVSDRSGRPNVYVMSPVGGQAKRLTFKYSENSEPVWSPKGDEIAFTGGQGGVYQLFVMDRNGGNVRQLSSGGGSYESPTWSPDGRLIAVSRKSGSRSEICVVSKNGKDIRVLFTMKGNQSYPQWSGRLP
ncbi:Tol-Pal system beta propeller repeat protein TolB [Desulfobulbus elongatus]|uniref:Tol-Pal system beta propeller repeat protein TolB n=1 Tax=Desulfobulbus elongatus TaxID=53332 RepID=UPI00068717C5|nr:Tol-Pal system beta propeller repeat protein TolB [Desulfobulbus elongatus]